MVGGRYLVVSKYLAEEGTWQVVKIYQVVSQYLVASRVGSI